jgi:hypothetical protein
MNLILIFQGDARCGCMEPSKVIVARFLPRVDAVIRMSYNYRGDLQSAVIRALTLVSVDGIELIRFRTGRVASGANSQEKPCVVTSVRLPLPIFEILVANANKMGLSRNELLNSVMFAFYNQPKQYWASKFHVNDK